MLVPKRNDRELATGSFGLGRNDRFLSGYYKY